MGIKDIPFPCIAPIASSMGIRLAGVPAEEAIHNPETQAEALAAFLKRFPDIDIAAPLMDTSVEARTLGCPWEFKGRVPVITGHICTDADAVDRLRFPEPDDAPPMQVGIKAVRNLTRLTNKPVAAFVVGPVTVAAHLMGLPALIRAALKDAPGFARILDRCAAVITPYAKALAEAGAQAIIMLEPQIMAFPPAVFTNSIRTHLDGIASQLPSPIMHVCGDTSRLCEAFAGTEHLFGLSLDAPVDFRKILDETPLLKAKTLLGNIDPVDVMLKGTPGMVREKVLSLVLAMKGERFILSSGCDLPPETPAENLDAFIEAALSLKG